MHVRTKQMQETGGIPVKISTSHMAKVASRKAVDEAAPKRKRFPWTTDQEEALAKQVSYST